MTPSAESARNLKLVVGLFVASVVFAGVQLALGANMLIVFLAVLTGLACLPTIYLYGPSRTLGVIFIMVWYIYSFGELLTKTVLLQTIDSDLTTPLLTHVIMLAGAVVFSLAGAISLWVTPFKGDLVKPVHDPGVLTVTALILFGFFLFSHMLRSVGGDVWAVGKFFGIVSGASMACATAAIIIQSGGRRTISILSIVLGILYGLDGVANNSKAGIMAVGFSYMLCRFALGVRPTWKVYGVVAAVMAFVSISLYPAIHLVRSHRDQVSPIELAAETLDLTIKLIVRDPATVTEADQLGFAENYSGYNQRIHPYLRRSDVWIDRFIAAGYVDQVARRVNFTGPFLGLDFVVRQSFDWLPKQLNPNKDISTAWSTGDMVIRALGTSYTDSHAFPTVPMPVELFASGGFLAIFLVALPTLILSFSAINIIAYNFTNNVWSIYVIVTHGYLITIDGYALYLFMVLRQFPVDVVLLSLVTSVATLIIHHLRPHRRGRLVKAPGELGRSGAATL